MVGTVYLVGSGPGDPALLTVKAKRLLEEADIVLHDKLPGTALLETIPPEKREDVGKRADGNSTNQQAINQAMVELARAGKTVVRLKGGDPFIFGRGGEEIEYLADHDVPFEIVPGVSSITAAPGLAGIPLTHRDHASSVAIVTGHEAATKRESAVDWATLANAGGTIVVLMGVSTLPDYAKTLIEAGLDPATPAAIIERASWETQQIVTGTIESLPSLAEEADIAPPATTVIGDVAATRASVATWIATNSGEDQ